MKTPFAQVLKFNPYHDKVGRFTSATDDGPREPETPTGGVKGPAVSPTHNDKGGVPEGKARVHSDGTPMTSANQGVSSTTQDESTSTKVPEFVWANDVKRGVKVRLNNGWEARIEDNKKGNTRLATVYGDYTEMGSVYTKDIKQAYVNGVWRDVKLSESQSRAAKRIRGYGF